MRFQYFTYFLNPVKQTGLFQKSIDKNTLLSEALLSFKKKPLEYSAGQSKLAFVVIRKVDNYIIARLGRRASLKRNLPPEKAFEETREENWPRCTLIFNLNADPEKGQKILFEFKSYIFPSPSYELRKLAEIISGYLLPNGYVMSINPVTIKQEFWRTIANYKSMIEKVTFSFNAPNLFNLNNSLENELREVQKAYSATKATIELENPDGKLNVPENDLTKQGVDYITKGGGEYKIKVKGRTRTIISSKGKIKTKEIDDLQIDLMTSDQETLFSFLDKIFE